MAKPGAFSIGVCTCDFNMKKSQSQVFYKIMSKNPQ